MRMKVATSHVRPTILIVTPATSGGSWVSLRELALADTECKFRYMFATLERKGGKAANHLMYSIPYLRYDKYGYVCGNALRALVYQLPLTILSSLLIILCRPKVVMANGLVTSFSVMPACLAAGSRLVLSFHGVVSYRARHDKRLARVLSKYLTGALANSRGAREDLAEVLDRNRIVVVEHWAHDAFFQDCDRDSVRRNLGLESKFVVLYVGRLDRDKLIGRLIGIADLLAACEDLVFLFAGVGEYETVLKRLSLTGRNVRYLGYISDRAKLHELYVAADLVWTYGEETYVARPGIEAMASGTPILLPVLPAILEKAALGIRLPGDLIPTNVGWIIECESVKAMAETLLQIMNRGTTQMRPSCRRYALAKHGSRNLRIAIDKLQEWLVSS